MAKIISSDYLNKKLTGNQLRSKVGNIQINSGNFSKPLGGADLKKFITKLGGKTDTQIEKILKDKYGVSGYQVKKRESIMKLIRGDKKNGLTEEQIKRNLKRNMQRDETVLEKEYSRTNINVLGKVGGGVHGDASRLGVGLKQVQSQVSAQNLNNNKPPDNPVSKPPSVGIRPLGL